MDLPVVEEQNAPSFTAAEIETIISSANGQDKIFYMPCSPALDFG